LFKIIKPCSKHDYQIILILKYFRTCKTKQNSNVNSNTKFKAENKNRKFKKEKERESLTCPPKQAVAAQNQSSPRTKSAQTTYRFACFRNRAKRVAPLVFFLNDDSASEPVGHDLGGDKDGPGRRRPSQSHAQLFSRPSLSVHVKIHAHT
jgi:hypothetical protein